MFDQLTGAGGLYQIRVRESDEWKMSFKTRDGFYKWLVMPFQLSNALSTYIGLVDHVLKPYTTKKKISLTCFL